MSPPTIKLRTLKSNVVPGGTVNVFTQQTLAVEHIRKHFLEPGQDWFEVLKESVTGPREFRNLIGPTQEIGQAHYDLYAGAIERAVHEAERVSLWQPWREERWKSEKGPTGRPDIILSTSTWVSPYGVRVEERGRNIVTSFRYAPSKRIIGSLEPDGLPPDLCHFARFIAAFDVVRKHLDEASMIEESSRSSLKRQWRRRRAATTLHSSPWRMKDVDFAAWKRMGSAVGPAPG